MAVFAAAATVQRPVVHDLWRRTAELASATAETLLDRLVALGLVEAMPRSAAVGFAGKIDVGLGLMRDSCLRMIGYMISKSSATRRGRAAAPTRGAVGGKG